jgi:hypothetical protein
MKERKKNTIDEDISDEFLENHEKENVMKKKGFLNGLLTASVVAIAMICGYVEDTEAKLSGAVVNILNGPFLAGAVAGNNPMPMNIPNGAGGPAAIAARGLLVAVLNQALLAAPGNPAITAAIAAAANPAATMFHHMVNVRHLWRQNPPPPLANRDLSYFAWCRGARVGTPAGIPAGGTHSSFFVPAAGPLVNTWAHFVTILTSASAAAAVIAPAPVGAVGGAPAPGVAFVPAPLPTYIRVATTGNPNVSFAVPQGAALGGNPQLPVPPGGVPPNTAFVFMDIRGAVNAGVHNAVNIGSAIKCNLGNIAVAINAPGPFSVTPGGSAAEAAATIAQVAATYDTVVNILPGGALPAGTFMPLFGGAVAASAAAPQQVDIIAIRIDTNPAGNLNSISMYPV